MSRIASIKYLMLFCILCIIGLHTAKSQSFIELGTTLGAVSYQGDLAPSNLRGSINRVHPYMGIYGQLHPTRFFGLELYGSSGNLSGNDIYQLDDGRRRRNLHFRTNLREIGARILLYLPIEIKTIGLKTDPYALIGVGYFDFDPEAEYKGIWYKLRDLNTEGQGLPQYPDRKPYALRARTIPLGAGIRVEMRNRWSVRLEGIMHTTNTDYIDDVSKTYPDLDLLRQEYGYLSYALANRSAERDGINDAREGGVRGNPNENDWYVSFQLKIAKNFDWIPKRDRIKSRYLKCRID